MSGRIRVWPERKPVNRKQGFADLTAPNVCAHPKAVADERKTAKLKQRLCPFCLNQTKVSISKHYQQRQNRKVELFQNLMLFPPL